MSNWVITTTIVEQKEDGSTFTHASVALATDEAALLPDTIVANCSSAIAAIAKGR